MWLRYGREKVSVEKATNLTKVTCTISPRETIVLKALSEGIDIIVKDPGFKGDLKPDEKNQMRADFLVQGRKRLKQK